MSNKALPYLVLSVGYLFAASSMGNNEESLAGNYTFEAKSVTGFDANGKSCGEAIGKLTIKDNTISGTVTSSQGFSLEVQGSTQSNGEATGSFAIAGNILATFTGTFSRAAGKGVWQDELECSGTWTAKSS